MGQPPATRRATRSCYTSARMFTKTYFLGCGLALILAPAVSAQGCVAKPATLPQGNTIRLRCSRPAATARMNGRTVPLFKQPAGDWLGLMPVAVSDRAGPNRIEVFADGKAPVAFVPVVVRLARFPTQNVTLAPSIEALHSSAAEIQTLTSFSGSVSSVRYWQDPFVAPVTGCVISPFGVTRLHNGKPTGEYHGGVDLRSGAGRPIRSVAGGSVKIAQPFTVLGGTVGLDHGQGLETMYLHMSRVAVGSGERVNRGDVIGYVGSTGRANGPHLHWVVYVNGVKVNPAQWVPLKTCMSAGRHPEPRK